MHTLTEDKGSEGGVGKKICLSTGSSFASQGGHPAVDEKQESSYAGLLPPHALILREDDMPVSTDEYNDLG